VALLLRVLLQEDITTRVLYAALLHDLAEQITGDMPADIKRRMGLTANMADLEEAELLLAGFDPPPLLTDIERKALKLADCLDGLIFCNREIELGNSAMLFIRARYLQYIDAMEGLPSDWRHLINSLRDRNP
jgi:5'-deoxynucleotidase YfbR-like HD superfamily hydrolase